MYACDIHKFPTERHVVITVSEINPERHVVITVSEINRLFHYDKSQYQCRRNRKSH
jgi:hypothetical protein